MTPTQQNKVTQPPYFFIESEKIPYWASTGKSVGTMNQLFHGVLLGQTPGEPWGRGGTEAWNTNSTAPIHTSQLVVANGFCGLSVFICKPTCLMLNICVTSYCPDTFFLLRFIILLSSLVKRSELFLHPLRIPNLNQAINRSFWSYLKKSHRLLPPSPSLLTAQPRHSESFNSFLQ